jgi:mRNA-degrading endonuclease RelE of RelBE toxin-antitoxin system
MARVELTDAAHQQVRDLPVRIQSRVWTLVARLEAWPAVSGAKPLRGSLWGRYRVRTGDYRVQFRVRGLVVIVEKVGHRDGFYDA